jgi:hypothetical protein
MAIDSPSILHNDSAMDYFHRRMSELASLVEEILADTQAADPDERGDSELVPTIYLMHIINDATGAAPPPAADVERWKESYLNLLQENARHYGSDATPYFQQRAEILRQLFDTLIQTGRP